MLTSLLPGLRELRAPLSAGAIWLLAGWFIAEPHVPGRNDATGVLASAYRLGELLEAVGLGAVLAFAAYMVGSLSVFVFSGLLRRMIRTSTAPSTFRLDGLSNSGREALQQVAQDSRQRLGEILSLSGFGVDDLLQSTVRPAREPDGKIVPHHRFSKRRRRSPSVLTASTVSESPQHWQERELASLVVRDLEVIADAQLLGNENDVFSAVDRNRAEAEFRVAVVPGVVALSAVMAVRQSSFAFGAGIVLLGIAASAGLMFDAAKQQRLAHDLLLNLLEHNRLMSPSLVRLESRATELADQSPAKVVSRQASATALAIQSLIASLESVPTSTTVGGLRQAVDAAVAARGEFDRLQGTLRQLGSGDSGDELDSVLIHGLESVVRGWATVNRGLIDLLPEHRNLLPAEDDPVPEPSELLDEMKRARDRYPIFVEQMRSKIVQISAREAAARSLPADA